MPGNDLTSLRGIVPTSSTQQATARANITTILNGILNDIEPKVSPAGLDMSSALSFLSGGVYSPITELGYLNLQDRAAGPGVNESVYVLGDELYYRDGNGNDVAITSGGSVSAAAGNITGAGYGTPVEINWNTATAEYRMKSAAGTHALADVVLDRCRFSDGSTYYATLGASAGMAATLDYSLPAAFPASTSAMTMTSAGVMGVTRDLSIDTLTLSGAMASSGAVSGTTGTFTDEVSATDFNFTDTRYKCVNALAGNSSTGAFNGALGTWTSSLATNNVYIPIPMDVGDVVGAVQVMHSSASATEAQVTVYISDGDGTVTSLGTSSFSSGSGWNSDLFDCTDHTMAADESLWVQYNPSNAGDILQSISVLYNHPA
jgi:hypothetical protein